MQDNKSHPRRVARPKQHNPEGVSSGNYFGRRLRELPTDNEPDQEIAGDPFASIRSSHSIDAVTIAGAGGGATPTSTGAGGGFSTSRAKDGDGATTPSQEVDGAATSGAEDGGRVTSPVQVRRKFLRYPKTPSPYEFGIKKTPETPEMER
jgi:hypothetical protein